MCFWASVFPGFGVDAEYFEGILERVFEHFSWTTPGVFIFFELAVQKLLQYSLPYRRIVRITVLTVNLELGGESDSSALPNSFPQSAES